MKHRPEPTRLAQQDVALTRLLDDLLRGVSEDESVVAPGTAVHSPSSSPSDAATAALNDLEEQPLHDESVAQAGDAAVPAWAVVGFRALLFRVGALRFAMPLIALHSVALLDQRPTMLPGQPAWQVGVIRYRGQSLRIADLMRLLGLASSPGPSRYLLVLGSGQMALACDEIDEAVEVGGESVRWRRSGASRAWLVGILADSLASVLDPAAIEHELGMDHA